MNVGLTPETVAEEVIASIEDSSATGRVFIATFGFQIMYFLGNNLPMWLGDRLLVAIA